jgi:hypothetical protein
MPMLLIKCPVTGKMISTGFSMDKGSFENPTNIMSNNSVRCPHCGQMHTWDKKDATLAE